MGYDLQCSLFKPAQKLLLQNPDCFLPALICITVLIISAVCSDTLVLLHTLRTQSISCSTRERLHVPTARAADRHAGELVSSQTKQKKLSLKSDLGLGPKILCTRAPLPFVLSALLSACSLLMIFFFPQQHKF